MMATNILFLVVGLLLFLFRKVIGHQLFEMHKESSMSVKKEGYPLMVGGVGGAFMGISVIIVAAEFLSSR